MVRFCKHVDGNVPPRQPTVAPTLNFDDETMLEPDESLRFTSVRYRAAETPAPLAVALRCGARASFARAIEALEVLSACLPVNKPGESGSVPTPRCNTADLRALV
jgi:hypothetical protein